MLKNMLKITAMSLFLNVGAIIAPFKYFSLGWWTLEICILVILLGYARKLNKNLK